MSRDLVPFISPTKSILQYTINYDRQGDDGYFTLYWAKWKPHSVLEIWSIDILLMYQIIPSVVASNYLYLNSYQRQQQPLREVHASTYMAGIFKEYREQLWYIAGWYFGQICRIKGSWRYGYGAQLNQSMWGRTIGYNRLCIISCVSMRTYFYIPVPITPL